MKNLTLESGLIIVYGSILLFNIIFSMVLWIKTHKPHYKILGQGCLLLLLTGIGQSLIIQSPYIYQALTSSTVFFGTFFFIKLLSLIIEEPFKAGKYYVVYLSGVLLTILFNILNLHPSLMALPALIGMGYPSLDMGIRTFLKKDKGTFLVKCFAAAEMIRTLHNLDYSYAYVHQEWLVLGFTLALIGIFATTTFATAAVLETLSVENTRYKMEIEYGAMMANSDRLAYLGQMANGMAHEINNPLAIIQLSTGQMKRLSEQTTLDRQNMNRYALLIEDAITRINKIIRGLQNFGRDAGSDPFQNISFEEIVKDTLFFMHEKLSTTGIEVRTRVLTKKFVTCRPTQISQVIISLLNNAISALAENKTEKWIQFEISEEVECVVLSISDNGSGISKENQDRIFHPFFTTKEIGQGTGLGLSSSLGIINSNRGSLTLKQTSPHTTFVVKLPKAY